MQRDDRLCNEANAGANNRSLDRILKNQGCSHEFLGCRRLCTPDSRAMWQRRFLAEVDVTEVLETMEKPR
jgi:hypothetical protein